MNDRVEFQLKDYERDAILGYEMPLTIGRNVVDETIVTVRDARGLPLLTTHDRDLALALARLIETFAALDKQSK